MKLTLNDLIFESTDRGIAVKQDDILLFNTTPEELIDIAKMFKKAKTRENSYLDD